MRAAGLLLLLVLPARSVAQASNAARVGVVLGALGRQARGQEWITRWADDADCIVDEGSEAEGGGLRNLDVFCVDDDVVVHTKHVEVAQPAALGLRALVDDTVRIVGPPRNPLLPARLAAQRAQDDPDSRSVRRLGNGARRQHEEQQQPRGAHGYRAVPIRRLPSGGHHSCADRPISCRERAAPLPESTSVKSHDEKRAGPIDVSHRGGSGRTAYRPLAHGSQAGEPKVVSSADQRCSSAARGRPESATRAAPPRINCDAATHAKGSTVAQRRGSRRPL